MKTSVITTLIENLSRLQEFIPEEDQLIDRVVANIMKSLHKQAQALAGFNPEEKAAAAHMGLNLQAAEILANDDETRTLLATVGKAALAYYTHVDLIEQAAQDNVSTN